MPSNVSYARSSCLHSWLCPCTLDVFSTIPWCFSPLWAQLSPSPALTSFWLELFPQGHILTFSTHKYEGFFGNSVLVDMMKLEWNDFQLGYDHYDLWHGFRIRKEMIDLNDRCNVYQSLKVMWVFFVVVLSFWFCVTLWNHVLQWSSNTGQLCTYNIEKDLL